MLCKVTHCAGYVLTNTRIINTVKKWGATLHPWATMPSQLLKLFFNNQYGVVPQGCNVAPHFNIELC